MALNGLYPSDWKQRATALKDTAGRICRICLRPESATLKMVAAHVRHQPWQNDEGDTFCVCDRCHWLYDARDNARKKRLWKRIGGGGEGPRQMHMNLMPIGFHDPEADLSSAAGFYPEQPPDPLPLEEVIDLIRQQLEVEEIEELLEPELPPMLRIVGREGLPDSKPEPPIPIAA